MTLAGIKCQRYDVNLLSLQNRPGFDKDRCSGFWIDVFEKCDLALTFKPKDPTNTTN